MKTVWKYPLHLSDTPQAIEVHKGADINLVAAQHGRVCLWLEIDTEKPVGKRWFVVRGTGHPIGEHEQWVGSCQMGDYVWHVYQVVTPDVENGNE